MLSIMRKAMKIKSVIRGNLEKISSFLVEIIKIEI